MYLDSLSSQLLKPKETEAFHNFRRLYWHREILPLPSPWERVLYLSLSLSLVGRFCITILQNHLILCQPLNKMTNKVATDLNFPFYTVAFLEWMRKLNVIPLSIFPFSSWKWHALQRRQCHFCLFFVFIFWSNTKTH